MRLLILKYFTCAALLLALVVVTLGAYTRLTNAGLGCPDWPGCYGHLTVPQGQDATLNKIYPNTPLETRKAWTEMIHRYAAGCLVLLILFTTIIALGFKSKSKLPSSSLLALLGLLIFQAALGMWTVTLKLLPVVVMSHLIGGALVFALLSYFASSLLAKTSQVSGQKTQYLILIGMIIVIVQIALGGWVSSNYAGIACIGFPTCNGQWLPELYFTRGFNLVSPVGVNYQGGVLDNNLRVTIQYVHRLGALVTAFYLFGLSTYLLFAQRHRSLQFFAYAIFCLICTQLILGVINVVYLLPLWAAVAHNGVAVLLLGVLTSAYYFSRRSLYARD
jgi:cytochrome c oxidase assembly protein subunit 15